MIPIDHIKIGERSRKDLGDVQSLARSIQESVLAHPLVLNSRLELIAGRRRLEACRVLGWSEVPCRVVDSLDDALIAMRVERDENEQRLPFAPSEAVEIKRRLEALERPKAQQRQKGGKGANGSGGRGRKKPSSNLDGGLPVNDHEKPSGNLPEGFGQTRDIIAHSIGIGARTLDKAEAVVAAAEQSPERFGDLATKMDQTRNVDRAYRELRRRQEPPPEPPPPPRYPASDKWRDTITRLVIAMEEIRQTYGSFGQMIDSGDWDPAETSYAKAFVSDFHRTFSELKKEIESAT